MIELIVLDVDGTMTDGKIYYLNSGDEIKAFNIKDGLMINSWNRLGKKSAIITGRNSDIVAKRAKELGVTFVKQGVKNKKESLDSIIQELGINYSEVAVIGDDMNDLSMLRLVKKSFAPYDANPYIYDFVNFPLKRNGGEGAVAEMIEMLLKEEKLYEKFLELW